MTCREALDFLIDYLEGNLTLPQKVAFKVHLALCRQCRDYLDAYEKTIRAVRESTVDQRLYDELPEELIQAILSSRNQSGTRIDEESPKR